MQYETPDASEGDIVIKKNTGQYYENTLFVTRK